MIRGPHNIPSVLSGLNTNQQPHRKQTCKSTHTTRTGERKIAHLFHHGEAGAGLDLVSHVLVLDDDAALGRVAGASAAVDEEAGATAHVVGGVGVQVVAVIHALEGAHVAEGVATLGKRADTHLALKDTRRNFGEK